jgi:hypothetical protein
VFRFTLINFLTNLYQKLVANSTFRRANSSSFARMLLDINEYHIFDSYEIVKIKRYNLVIFIAAFMFTGIDTKHELVLTFTSLFLSTFILHKGQGSRKNRNEASRYMWTLSNLQKIYKKNHKKYIYLIIFNRNSF